MAARISEIFFYNESKVIFFYKESKSLRKFFLFGDGMGWGGGGGLGGGGS